MHLQLPPKIFIFFSGTISVLTNEVGTKKPAKIQRLKTSALSLNSICYWWCLRVATDVPCPCSYHVKNREKCNCSQSCKPPKHKLTNMTLQITFIFQRHCKIIFSRKLDMAFYHWLTRPSHLTLLTLLFMLLGNLIIQPSHSNQVWNLPKIEFDWYIKTSPHFQLSV